MAAQEQQRAIVTENVRDFRPLASEWQARDKVHFGLVLTTNRRFPRADPRTPQRLVKALAKLMQAEDEQPSATNREIWLE